MKNFILLFLIIGSVMIFFSCQEGSVFTPELNQSENMPVSLAKKPSPNLIGAMDCDFTFTPPYFWNGTVDFGVGGKYSITYKSLGQMRQYSQARPFEEEVIIYELGTDWTNPANVYLKGSHSGVMTFANKVPDPVKFQANGKIEEAYGPLEMWQGRNYHISGVVTFIAVGQPEGCSGIFRIN